MSAPTLPEEELLQLLVQLKKTTPEQARAILNVQPQIAYALITLMVKINAVDVEVLHQTLARHAATSPANPQAPIIASSVPPHLAGPNRIGSPGQHPPPIAPQQPSLANGYPRQPPTQPGSNPYPPGSQPPRAPAAMNQLPDALAALPDDQKAMILRVISMTPDEIRQLPPQDRTNVLQVRASLGLPG